MKNQEFKFNITDKIKNRLLEEEGSEDPISEEAWASEKNKGKKLNKPFRALERLLRGTVDERGSPVP